MEFIQEGQAFVYRDESGQMKAEITYQISQDPSVIVADHTFVDPSLRGLGVAEKLLDRLVQFAKENHLTIKPQCSYVVRKFEQDEDKYQDVIAK